MIGIELFSGAGGMSVGASMAGVDVKMAIEIDKSAAKTFKRNHPHAKIINEDIRSVKSLDLRTRKPKILFGGPPCQGFSRSNHRTRTKENPNNWLFQEFFRMTKLWMPDWIVLENVEGLTGTEGGFFIEQIINTFEEAGYTISAKVLSAVNFGIPQKRTRLFIVGSLHGIKYKFPEQKSSNIVTVKEALEDLPVLENGNSVFEKEYSLENGSLYSRSLRGALKSCGNHLVSRNTVKVIERYKHIPQGGNWQNIPIEIMDSYKDVTRCHTGIYYRLDENKPSVVIGNYRKNMLIHPSQPRGLSVREAARLQSFPDWFVFEGGLGDQQQQVGNAVPPFLAREVFKEILLQS